MKLHELQPATGSRKSPQPCWSWYFHLVMVKLLAVSKRSRRSGGGVRLGFEGGQTPLFRRLLQKRGFTNINAKEYAIVNSVIAERLEGKK